MTKLTDIKKQFEESNLFPLFEIEVQHKDTGAEDYIIFDVSIQGGYFVAQHVALTRKEEKSKKIAFKKLVIDTDFSLDENLQELFNICQNAIIESDFYTLPTE